MKRFYTLIFSLSVIIQSYSQPDWEMINFDDSTYLNYIIIDTVLNSNNVWQIGPPDKQNFNQAFSIPNAIVTDTVQAYPVNDTSVFYIEYVIPDVPGYWMYTVLHFFYKIDTDEDSDFGKIEFSPNNGQLWVDYINDSIYNNCYDGNEPYFTGTSDDWEFFEIYNDPWCFDISIGDTVLYKFTFISDDNHTGKDGWIIDDIVLYDFWETIGEYKINNQIIKAYPNPVSEQEITFEFQNTKHLNEMELRCFNIFGELIFMEKVYQHQGESKIGVQNWQKGIYFVIVYSNGLPVAEVKFIVQ